MTKHKHKKSGHVVRVVGYGRMQTEKPIGDLIQVVIYTHGHNIWVRPTAEFNDGRFEEVKDND